MDIPTNDEGMFEVVTADEVVVGHGIVSAGSVDFAYSDGVQEGRVVASLVDFQVMLDLLPPFRHLTVRAAA